MRKREIGKERKRKKERERKRETVWALNSKRNFDKKFDFSYFPFCEKKASCVSDGLSRWQRERERDVENKRDLIGNIFEK